jgi:hypothetical protein
VPENATTVTEPPVRHHPAAFDAEPDPVKVKRPFVRF